MPQTKVPPPITRADYEGMPAGPPYFQVIDGDLIMSPSPNTFHQDIAGRIYARLLAYTDECGAGRVFIAPLDVFLSETNIYQPDVCFVSAERSSIITEKGLEGAPSLVVEILSGSTAKYDRGAKRKNYARFGIQELWLVSPDNRTVEVYDLERNANDPVAAYGASDLIKSPLLPGLKLHGEEIFKGGGPGGSLH